MPDPSVSPTNCHACEDGGSHHADGCEFGSRVASQGNLGSDDSSQLSGGKVGLGQLGVSPVCDFGGRNGAEHTTVEWYTPAHIFDALGMYFDLDPCAPEGGVPWIPSMYHYSIKDDGLAQRWFGHVWLNPPYGREAAVWVDRLIAHGDGVALVFARVDAAWAQRAIKAADALCLIAGRISFVSGNGPIAKGHNAAAPSMLLGFGAACAEAVVHSGLGIVLNVNHTNAPNRPCL